MTDILASLLGVSMVISSGTAKSLGLFVMERWQVDEFWMPALIGAVALPILALLGFALNALPQPDGGGHCNEVRTVYVECETAESVAP